MKKRTDRNNTQVDPNAIIDIKIERTMVNGYMSLDFLRIPIVN